MLLLGLTVLALLGAAVWIIAPLAGKGQAPRTYSPDGRLDDLMEAKQAVLRSILDLEFDRRMDKVSQDDYRVMRAQHEAEALAILAEMDGAGWTTDPLEMEIAAARDRLRR